MEIYTEIIGNMYQSSEWKQRLEHVEIEFVYLDQWTAQKSRFLAKSDKGKEYPIALKRHTQVADGDIIYYSSQENRAIVLRIDLNPVLVIDMSGLSGKSVETIMRISVELGHSIGNQHWPAVVKGMKVYVPLTVDRKVMLSVMDTHHIEGIAYDFQKGQEVIPYLAPHEIRRLFGGTAQMNHSQGEEHCAHAHLHQLND